MVKMYWTVFNCSRAVFDCTRAVFNSSRAFLFCTRVVSDCCRAISDCGRAVFAIERSLQVVKVACFILLAFSEVKNHDSNTSCVDIIIIN